MTNALWLDNVDSIRFEDVKASPHILHDLQDRPGVLPSKGGIWVQRQPSIARKPRRRP
jgi:hypothetical protein